MIKIRANIMEPIVKKRIIEISQDILNALIKKDNVKLKILSNYTIHNASIFQDEDSISIATITYALSKIIERYKFKETKIFLNFHKNIIAYLETARKELINNKYETYRKNLESLLKLIEEFDHKLALYVQRVIEKSKIKKGSVMFEHGISLARVADLLGISRWDLMGYIGKTRVFDIEKSPSVKQRLNFTRKLFGIR